jgi:hypothetical protein
MKKLYLLIIGILIGMSSTAFAAYSIFPDVQPGSYYYDAVQSVANKGLVTGYGNGYFGPNDNLTRAQIAVIMERYDEHMINTLKWQFGLDFKCPANNTLTCTGGGPLGSGCRSQAYQDWMNANCGEIDILE